MITEIYPHYGMAYQYLQDNNGIENVMAMMRDARTFKEHHDSSVGYTLDYFPYADPEEFVLAWDNADFVDKNNQPLSLKRWIENYHDILGQ